MSLELRGVSPLLQVYDMPAAVRFYCDVLGFTLVNHSPFYAEGEFHWAMLDGHGIRLMLNTAYDEGERPANPEKARVAAHGDTSLYFECPDVDAMYAHLVAKGIKLEPPSVARYGFRQINLLDPDGYHLCLQWPVA